MFENGQIYIMSNVRIILGPFEFECLNPDCDGNFLDFATVGL